MSRYVLSEEALIELDEIWGYISQGNPNAADEWIEKLLDACDTIARNPRLGHKRADITDKSVLFWPVNTYLIVYRVNPDHIEVLAVTQGSRDIPSYLRRRT
ncbi:MAG TPA: type II toxin-antitoxin system RelE/ParE family toxin [Terracidiphilus sp.]|nr:type II toxin-antitoxin system RelE/ParE family toxin [Terracidiphilus sp.]